MTKICCTCRYNIRKDKDGRIECECEITKRYIGYVQCMTSRCKHWTKESEKEKEQYYMFGYNCVKELEKYIDEFLQEKEKMAREETDGESK